MMDQPWPSALPPDKDDDRIIAESNEAINKSIARKLTDRQLVNVINTFRTTTHSANVRWWQACLDELTSRANQWTEQTRKGNSQ